MTDTIVTNVNVFDGTGADPYAGQVHVHNDRIQRVARRDERIVAPGAVTVDGSGLFLMPGMVNCHGHPTYPNMGADFYDPGELPVEEHTLRTMHNVRIMLDMGFTASVNGSSAKPRLDIAIRNEINAGRIPGPRMRAASPEITVSGGLGDVRQFHMYHEAFAVVCDGPEEIRKFTRVMIREGVDNLKLMISGDNFVPNATAEMTVMQEDEIAACCSLAKVHQKRVIAHARTAESVKACVKHGIDLIYHANFADEEAISRIVANKDRFFVNPAIGLSYTSLYEMADYGMSTEKAESLGFKRELDGAVRVCKELFRRGVRVLPFGDYGFEWNHVGKDARDLELWSKLMGFSNRELLVMATKWGGECYGDRVGLLAEGYFADIILIDGNPLEDITVLQKPERILMVMKDGLIHRDLRELAGHRRVGIAAE